MEELIITVRLSAAQVNLILGKLGQCPYVEVVEIIGLIKSQGDAAVEAARQRQASPPLWPDREQANGAQQSLVQQEYNGAPQNLIPSE